MKSRLKSGVAIMLLWFMMIGVSQATLVKIGSIEHSIGDWLPETVISDIFWDEDYKDNSGNSLLWIDFVAVPHWYGPQVHWASTIRAVDKVIDDGFMVESVLYSYWKLASRKDMNYLYDYNNYYHDLIYYGMMEGTSSISQLGFSAHYWTADSPSQFKYPFWSRLEYGEYASYEDENHLNHGIAV